MTKSDTYEKDLLSLLLCATPIANVADNAASSPITSIWASLHTADPADTGTQGTSEANYTGYTRIAVTRSTAGFVVSTSNGTASPVAAITFPEAASTTTMTLTHCAFGQASATTGGKVFYSGTISPNISIGSGVTPRLTTASSITED
jgi:hypothetical protein